MSDDQVADDEILFRRIGQKYYTMLPTGELKISSSAFSDRAFRISVNRAILCNHDPSVLRENPTDGVASLVAGDIRAEPIPHNDAKGRVIQVYPVEVSPDPQPDNPSHAVIHTEPIAKPIFDKLTKRLANLAIARGWALPPEETA